MRKLEQIAQSVSDIIPEEDKQKFLDAFEIPSPVSIRIHPKKLQEHPDLPPVPWNDYGYYLPKRPVFTLDPLLHAGAYYVQEAGSMFISYIVKQLPLPDTKNILDLCAAPGGKSSLLSTFVGYHDLLVSNEISRSRLNALKENLVKWGEPNIFISNNDHSAFEKTPAFFDLILVDAPCSGEGMIRKDPDVLDEWSADNVAMCATRQKDILASAWEALKPGGFLIYSTCTFNTEENENNLQWMFDEYGAENFPVMVMPHWNIIHTKTALIDGYRFFPHKISSEGFFVSVMHKPGTADVQTGLKIKYPAKNFAAERIANKMSEWLIAGDYVFIQEKEEIFAIPKQLFERYEYLKERIELQYYGAKVLEIKGEDLIPAPELAMSLLLNKSHFPVVETEKKQALKYLRRDQIKFKAPLGWNLITYKGLGLGWIKQLENRSNNYFPKEWRILMQLPEESDSVLSE